MIVNIMTPIETGGDQMSYDCTMIHTTQDV